MDATQSDPLHKTGTRKRRSYRQGWASLIRFHASQQNLFCRPPNWLLPAPDSPAPIIVFGVATTFTLPSKAFTDPQGSALTCAATLSSGAALPTWLKFNAATAGFKTAVAAAVNGIKDGYVGISSANPMNWDPTNRAVAGLYDPIGAIEHEITEVMGRSGSLGVNSGAYTALDLFRYSSPGARFAARRGIILDRRTNDVASLMTAVDVREMNVIGWNRASLTA